MRFCKAQIKFSFDMFEFDTCNQFGILYYAYENIFLYSEHKNI